MTETAEKVDFDEALVDVVRKALEFADWAAGEGITPDASVEKDPAIFMFDFWVRSGVKDPAELNELAVSRIRDALL